jgi:predicted  nucleic acid-binding Zn-ribbon protein
VPALDQDTLDRLRRVSNRAEAVEWRKAEIAGIDAQIATLNQRKSGLQTEVDNLESKIRETFDKLPGRRA